MAHLRSLLGHLGPPTGGLQEEQQAHARGPRGTGGTAAPKAWATLCLTWWLCLRSSQTSLSAHRAALRLVVGGGAPPPFSARALGRLLAAVADVTGDGPPPARLGKKLRLPVPVLRLLPSPLSLQVRDVLCPHVGLDGSGSCGF